MSCCQLLWLLCEAELEHHWGIWEVMHALCCLLMSLHALFLALHIFLAAKQEIVLWKHEATILYIRKCRSNVLRQVIFSNRKPYDIFVRNASSPVCKLQRIYSSWRFSCIFLTFDIMVTNIILIYSLNTFTCTWYSFLLHLLCISPSLTFSSLSIDSNRISPQLSFYKVEQISFTHFRASSCQQLKVIMYITIFPLLHWKQVKSSYPKADCFINF